MNVTYRNRRVAEIENKSAQRKEKQRRLENEAKEEQRRELERMTRENDAKIMTMHHMVTQKLNSTLSEKHKLKQEELKQKEDEMQHRVEVVYQLKQSQTAVNAELAGIASKHRTKVAAAAKRLEDDKEELLAKGMNPYIEFRKKELDNEARSREQRLKNAVERNKVELKDRLEREAKFIEKQQKTELKAKEYEQQHRASQGRQVVEGKNNDYILQQTKGKMEILDPLGKAIRIYPSQIVEKYDKDKVAKSSGKGGVDSMRPGETIKDFTKRIREGIKQEGKEIDDNATGYGSDGDKMGATEGISEPAVSQSSITSSLDEAANSLLSSKLTAQQINQFEMLATQPGSMPGIDKTAVELNLRDNEVDKKELIKLAIDEEGKLGASSQLVTFASPKYKLNDLSKFERDALDRAKERHHDRIVDGVEQIAGGKVFQGKAFVSTPSDLIFYDFEVGKTYKKKFSLTNVSYTFNSFKYIDLDEDHRDFFTVTFEKPGRMSAGMTCSLDIEFRPRVNQDIFIELKFLTQTGPVEIPLHCLIKRCAPRIITPEIDFGTIVMGQMATLQFKMINTQAIATKFFIHAVDDNDRVIAETSENMDTVGMQPTDRVEAVDGSSAVGDDNNVETSDNNNNHIGNEPALNDAELQARVDRVRTQVVRDKKRENPQPLSCKVTEGFLDGYGNATVNILCAPVTLGEIVQKFIVKFDSVDEIMLTKDDVGVLVKKEQMVTARVFVEEVPIYIAEDIMDFRCTLYQRIYRKKIIVKNRGKSAYRIIIKIAPRFNAFVEVNPNMFFVQAKSSQSMNVRFTPTAEMLSKIAHFVLPYEEYHDAALVSLPIEVQVVNQEIPAYFTIMSNITPSTIELIPSTLDFGRVYVGQKLVKTIQIKNLSMLPQKIGFVKLKKEFNVQPNDGFAVLLPNETTEFEVSFSPTSSINYQVDVTLQTSFNDTYLIKVLADGVDPPLQLESSVIHMRTTYPGERVVESTMVRNTSKHTQLFQVIMPHKLYTWLTISPTVLELSAGQSGRLEIEFCPPADAKDLDPLLWHTQTINKTTPDQSPFESLIPDSGWVFAKGMYGQVQWVKAGAHEVEKESKEHVDDGDGEIHQGEGECGEDEASTNQDIPAEEWGIFAHWNFPLFLKSNKKKIQSMDNTLASSTTDSAANTTTMLSPTNTLKKSKVLSSSSVVSPLFLSIETSVTLPQLESDMKTIDFGQVSIGTRLIRSFKILNRTSKEMKLRSVGFNAVGPFTLLKPIKKIDPFGAMTVLVECLPARSGLNVEVLEVSSEDAQLGGHRITLTFKVQGLQPAMILKDLQPPPKNWDPKSGILDFGHVLSQDFVVKKFTIENKSTFTINVVILRVPSIKLPPNQQSEMIERTFNGLPIFSIRPTNVVVEQGTSQEIEVTFCPDRGRFHPYREDIDVTIADTKEVIRVGLFGRCWERQLILFPQDPRDEAIFNKDYEGTSAVEDVLSVNPVSSVRTIAQVARESMKIVSPQIPKLTLVFPDPFGKDVSPSSYVEMDNGAVADASKAAAGKGAKGAPVAIIPTNPGARSQTKKIVLACIKAWDNRPGSTTPGTYEIVLSGETKASNLFTFSVDKGNLAIGIDTIIDVTCTLPKPRSLGGIFVGSWKYFDVEVIMKGGWRPDGAMEVNKLPLVLKAYVSL